MAKKQKSKNTLILPKEGVRYGRLTVTGKWETRKAGRKYWEFQCDCGSKKWIMATNVRCGKTKSCGCLQREATAKNIINLAGQRFGRLVVQNKTKKVSGWVHWKCKCDCGKSKYINGLNLRHGRTRSCGCLEQESRGKSSKLKLNIGDKFGLLTILGPNKTEKGKSVWECLCECGSKTWVSGVLLKSKNTRSCGCLVKKKAAARSRKRNKFPVLLSTDERNSFELISKSRKASKRDKVRAKILLLADRSEAGPGLDDVQIAERLKLTWGKVTYVRYSFTNPNFRKNQNKKAQRRWWEDIEYRIKRVISHRIRISLINQSSNKTHKALELLGCSLNEFRDHLEAKFKPGMLWDNFGQDGWHLDHVRPCASYDLKDEVQLRECFNYTNYQPLWASENIRKSSTWQGKWWGNR